MASHKGRIGGRAVGCHVDGRRIGAQVDCPDLGRGAGGRRVIDDDLGLDLGHRVGGGDGVRLAGVEGEVRVDDGAGGGAGREDLDVVGASRNGQVAGDRAEGDGGENLRAVDDDIDGRGVRRAVEDADLGRVRSGGAADGAEEERSCNGKRREGSDATVHGQWFLSSVALVDCPASVG
jgi:hypothetical protein